MNNNDRFVNLTNYAVQKHCKDRKDECMITYEEFQRFVSDTYSEADFARVQADIEKIITEVSFAARDNMEPRANTFQILGWDFMVDEELRVWLIETNRSPDLMPTTGVTKRLTEQLWLDVAQMFCDHE